jgi:hypothetical protein
MRFFMQAVNNSNAVLVVLVTDMLGEDQVPDTWATWATGLGFIGLQFECRMTVYTQCPNHNYKPGNDLKESARRSTAYFFKRPRSA